jgi:hypothetical protein
MTGRIIRKDGTGWDKKKKTRREMTGRIIEYYERIWQKK